MSVQIKNWAGLSTDLNPYSQAPEGSMRTAKNIVHRKPGLIEPREGLLFANFAHVTGGASQLHSYQGDVIALNASQIKWFTATTSTLVNQDGTTAVPIGPYYNAVEMRDNLYIPTDRGILKYEAPGDITGDYCGLRSVKRIRTISSLTGSPTSLNWFVNGTKVAYRIVLRRVDANGVVLLSAPTGKAFDENSGINPVYERLTIDFAAAAVVFNHVKEGDFIDVYRTKAVLTADPIPNLFYLSGTHEVTAAEVTAGSAVYDDFTTEEALGEALYTNAGQRQRYFPPLKPKVINSYQGSLFAFNLTSHQYIEFSFTPATTAAATTPISPGQQDYAAVTFTSGSPTFTAVSGHFIQVGQTIHNAPTPWPTDVTEVISVVGNTITMNRNASASGSFTFSMRDVIEFYSNGFRVDQVRCEVGTFFSEAARSDFYFFAAQDEVGASFSSSSDFIGGRVRFEEPYFSANTFTAAATHGDLFTPPLPLTTGTPVEFDQDELPNLGQWSDFQEPENFQTVNSEYIGLGPGVEGAFSVGNRQYIFFEDASIYTCQGESARSGFRFDRMNGQYRLISPTHLCTFGEAQERGAAWTDQGVIIIDEMGNIEDISTMRIRDILDNYLIGDTTGNLKYDVINDELILCAESADAGRVCLRYNVLTQFWSTVVLDEVLTNKVPSHSVLPPTAQQGKGLAFWTGASLWSAIAPYSTLNGQEFEHYSDYSQSTIIGGGSVGIVGGGISAVIGTYTIRFKALNVGDVIYIHSQGFYGVVVTIYTDTSTDIDVDVFTASAYFGSAAGGRVYYRIVSEIELVPQADVDIAAWKSWDEVEYNFTGGGILYSPTMFVKSSNIETEQAVPGPIRLTYTGGLDERPRIPINQDHQQSLTLRPGIRVAEPGRWYLAAITLHSRTENRRYLP